MSQCQTILEYLIMVPGRRISTWIAYENWHITTLAQRVQDLRHDLKTKPLILNGIKYEIKDELVTKNGKTFSEYFLSPVKVLELQETLF